MWRLDRLRRPLRAYGLVEITSRPMANLHVDGAPLGTTPFKGKLPVGRHEIRLSARGYNPWMGALEVDTDGTLPLSVQLRGKGPGQKDSGRSDKADGATPTAPARPRRGRRRRRTGASGAICGASLRAGAP